MVIFNSSYAQNWVVDFESAKKSKTFQDSLSAKIWLDKFIFRQQKKGFVQIKYEYEKTLGWLVIIGERYKIDSTLINGKLLFEKEGIFNHQKNLRSVLLDSTQNGLPFFKIKTDSIKENKDGAVVYYSTISGPNYVFGNVLTPTPIVVKPTLLKRLLHWKTGANFKLNQLSKIDKQLKSIPYLTVNNPPSIQFINDSAHLNISLTKKQVNQFDAIIGFQPNETTNKTEIIADVNLQLYNIAKRTDTWKLRWSTPESNTQKLNASTTLPLLFNTPFGYNLDLFLLKQDSSYINSNIKNGIVFTPNFYTNIIIYTGLKKISPIGENVNTITSIINRSFGLKLNYQQLNNLFNPSSGWLVTTDISQGKQKSSIQETSTNAIFNTAEGIVTNYTSILKKITLKQLIAAGSIATKGIVTQAELFEVGGFSSFRGVNERFIRTSDYLIYSFAPRYRLDEFSFAEIFYENIWFSNNQNKLVNYWNIGGGFAFSTKGGIFSLSYAVSDLGNGLTPKNGKIHFGYINLF